MAASILALGLLASCSTYRAAMSYVRSDSALKCPDAVILANASSLPGFAPATGGDPSGLVYTIAMNNVKTKCDYNKSERTADARTRIFVHAERTTGGHEAVYRVPYFVAVTTNGEILDKKTYWMDFSFRSDSVVADAEEVVESTLVTVAKGKQPYDYHLIVGFQLTKEQLDFNSKMGRYAP